MANLITVLGLVLLLSIVLSVWSLRDLKSPQNLYPKLEKKVRKVLSGVIHLPKSR